MAVLNPVVSDLAFKSKNVTNKKVSKYLDVIARKVIEEIIRNIININLLPKINFLNNKKIWLTKPDERIVEILNKIKIGIVDPLCKPTANNIDNIKNNEINLIINTPLGEQSRYDEYEIGKAAIQFKIPVITTISGANAVIRAIRIGDKKLTYLSLQEIFNYV